MSITFDIQCYSLSMFVNYEKYKHLENSDKILIPQSIMMKINSQTRELPSQLIFSIKKMIFDENNMFYANDCKCQLFEFVEGIDNIYIPSRIMQSLWLKENDLISLEYISYPLPMGTKIILKPHTSDFLEIMDTKDFLENGLNKNYSILNQNDTISIPYQEKIIYFDVLKTEPKSTILISDTDLEVDFEAPFDYKEKEVNKTEELIENDIEGIKEKINNIFEKEEPEITERVPINNFISNSRQTTLKKSMEFVPFSGNGNRLGSE